MWDWHSSIIQAAKCVFLPLRIIGTSIKDDPLMFQQSAESILSCAVALLHLLRIENDAAYASLLDRTGQQVSLRVVEKSLGLKIEPLSKPELRQVTELVSATTKWRRYLDYVIESIFAREGKKQKVKGIMKQLLRLGACEVLKLGQPSHVVNELVQLTKCIKGGGNNAAKFVNYVLRQVTEMKEGGKLPEPSVEEGLTKADILGIVHSQPTVRVARGFQIALNVEQYL
jgi:16S rRNA (cytosine967-C5)-methyltransferase